MLSVNLKKVMRNNILKTIKNKLIVENQNSIVVKKVTIGEYTYGLNDKNFVLWEEDANIRIGKFCSFANGVNIFGGGEHNYKNVTTFPLIKKFGLTSSSIKDVYTKGDVIIKNDVWVGRDALILSGLTIGNGAVIGARTLVSKYIPDYAIAIGNPMKIIKYRFTNQQIVQLLSIRWWDWDINKIIDNIELFYGNIDMFIKKFEFK